MRRFSSLSPRERRVIAAGAIVLVVGLLVGRVAPAWAAWVADERERAILARGRLAAARNAIANLAAERDTLMTRNGRYLAIAPALLAGSSVQAAGVALASVVSGAAASAGLDVGALQLAADTTSGGVFARVSVRGDLRGDVAGVTDFLLALERQSVLLAIRRFAVSQPDPGAASDRPEALRLEVTVEGLTLDRDAVRRLDPGRPDGDTASFSGGIRGDSARHPTERAR
jgi:hypothetical protein